MSITIDAAVIMEKSYRLACTGRLGLQAFVVSLIAGTRITNDHIECGHALPSYAERDAARRRIEYPEDLPRHAPSQASVQGRGSTSHLYAWLRCVLRRAWSTEAEWA
jgi:hypothetical protein